MKTTLLILFLVFCPLVLGFGADAITNFTEKLLKRKTDSFTRFGKFLNAFSTGVTLMLLIAGISNILCVFLNLNLSRGGKLFAVIMIIVLTIMYTFIIINKVSGALKKLSAPKSAADTTSKTALSGAGDKKDLSVISIVALIISVILSIFAIIIAINSKLTLMGDQTIEAVNSFISTGQMYSVDPLCGLPYQNSYPSRLPLMCLPYFYAVLSNAFSVSPYILLKYIFPVYFLLTGLSVFYTLGETLFDNKEKRIIFFAICVLLLFCTDVSLGMIGFDVFHAGYRAANVLNLILLPKTFVFCIRKKWAAALLTIILEPLLASTSFGVGACFFASLIMFIISRLPFYKKRFGTNNNSLTGSAKEGGMDK